MTPHNEPEIRLHAVARRGTNRVLDLRGAVDAEIEYTTAGFGERVLVDGRVAAQSSGFTLDWKPVTVCPRIDFRVRNADDEWVPARVDVSVSFLFWKGLNFFRLTVDGETIYEERGGDVLVPDVPEVRPARDE